MTSEITTISLIVFLLIFMTVTLLLMTKLVLGQSKTGTDQSDRMEQLLVMLLMEKSRESQSLLNQLRSGPDLQALHGLNQATSVVQPQSETYTPSSGDAEYLNYVENLKQTNYVQEEIPIDLAMAGWEGNVTDEFWQQAQGDSEPVRFE